MILEREKAEKNEENFRFLYANFGCFNTLFLILWLIMYKLINSQKKKKIKEERELKFLCKYC